MWTGVAGRVGPELSFGGRAGGGKGTPKSLWKLESADSTGGVSTASAQHTSRSSPG